MQIVLGMSSMLFLSYEDTLHVFGVLLEGFIHYTHNCLWGSLSLLITVCGENLLVLPEVM